MSEQVNEFLDNPLDGTVNLVTNYYTGGLVGYKDGKLSTDNGYTTQGLKEVTGANAAEEANRQAREQFEAQTAAAQEDRANAQLTNQRNQIAASTGATAARGTAIKKTTPSQQSQQPAIGDVSDFLGL